MAHEKISCGVDTCQYWGQGNKCQAEKIMVATDAAASGTGVRMEAGKQSTAADNSSNTKCETFRPK